MATRKAPVSYISDHDLLQRVVVATETMAQDISEMKLGITGLRGSLVDGQLVMARIQEAQMTYPQLTREHQELYGFYSTFKQFLLPLMLSGPVSAIVSALATYWLIRGH